MSSAFPDSAERPLHVAIVGAGPAGFYVACNLFKAAENVRVSMVERLPTPYGLVRNGVAPDHESIRKVTRVYDQAASEPRFAFFGNVTLGRDLSLEELHGAVDAVVICTGAERGRGLDLPGADLPGVYDAARFVYWYNGHPDHAHTDFELDGVSRAVVVGNGNVAVDVARILTRDPEELARTDLAAPALVALRHSRVREVVMLGRRGPAQAAFTPKEAHELGGLKGVDVVVDPTELVEDPATAAWMASGEDVRTARKNLEVLTALSRRPLRGHSRRLVLRFRSSPVAFEAASPGGGLAGVRVQPNELRYRDGQVKAAASGPVEVLPAELVLAAIGYESAPVSGLPFDADAGRVPNREGRLVDPATGAHLTGLYSAGWAKRGATGLIGTNKTDASATVALLLEDLLGRESAALPGPDLGTLLRDRGVRVVSWADWQRIEAVELKRGAWAGKPREKLVDVAEMLDLLDD